VRDLPYGITIIKFYDEFVTCCLAVIIPAEEPMQKLIILIGPVADTIEFSEGWPEFLHYAEEMPNFVREATIRVHANLYGDQDIRMIHELFFENQELLQQALASNPGQLAGAILQKITNGQMSLLTAEHKEDDAENLRKYREARSDAETQ